MRIEKDFLGQKEIPEGAMYGIHSLRAKENFPDSTPFAEEWYKGIGLTKLACYETYRSFKRAVVSRYETKDLPIRFMSDKQIDGLIQSATNVSNGLYFAHFIVPAIQGGAGTSINMNINEIIANAALHKLGYEAGQYRYLDPIEHANVYQSTNDVVPTGLTVAAIKQLTELEESINRLRFTIEKIESANRHQLRLAYTQMQQAVPSSYGNLFSTYNEALSRDWWRVSKCFERIKVVNLGGSAVGTAIAVPRYFVMEVIPALQRLTALPITGSENLSDATNNQDKFVEVHAILKSHAVNLEKMVSDIRLLSSDLIEHNELSIPQQQVGSSIMPGKVNPVIPEFVIGVAHKIYSNDSLITGLAALGCLDLNAYIPVIGHALLESIRLLIAANNTLNEKLFKGLTIYMATASEKLYKSPAITTVLSPYIGYNKAAVMAKKMEELSSDVFEANRHFEFLTDKKIREILAPQNLLKKGFSIKDIIS